MLGRWPAAIHTGRRPPSGPFWPEEGSDLPTNHDALQYGAPCTVPARMATLTMHVGEASTMAHTHSGLPTSISNGVRGHGINFIYTTKKLIIHGAWLLGSIGLLTSYTDICLTGRLLIHFAPRSRNVWYSLRAQSERTAFRFSCTLGASLHLSHFSLSSGSWQWEGPRGKWKRRKGERGNGKRGKEKGER